MELRICGSETELAAFIKALGSTITIESTMPKIETKVEKIESVKVEKVKPKAIAPTPKIMIGSVALGKKCGITSQTVINYTKKGMPYVMDGQKFMFDEAVSMAWMKKYQSKHPNKARGKKYASTKIKVTVNESDFAKWKKNITTICRESGINEGKLLSLAYKRMTKNYGIVWEQLAKEFYQANDRKPVSTLELAYALEQSKPVYKNLLESNIDAVVKESKSN